MDVEFLNPRLAEMELDRRPLPEFSVGRKTRIVSIIYRVIQRKMLSEKAINQYWWQTLPQKADQYCPESPIFTGRIWGNEYVETCELCALGFAQRLIHTHCKSTDHIRRVTQLIDIQRDRSSLYYSKLHSLLVKAQQEETKISKLLWEPWKDMLRGRLFPYHQWDVENGQFPSTLPSIDEKLQELLHCERLSLLELAVWKHFILLHYYPNTSAIEVMQFLGSGWKKHKKDAPRRTVSAVGIVVTHVLTFLKKP